MKTQEIDPNELVPNEWNTNIVAPENEEKLIESIKRLGMFKPIIVRELPTGELQIIGGEHRARAAITMGMKKVPIVNLGKVNDARAKEISLIDNGRYGTDDTLRLAELLESLGKPAELATFMPDSDAEMTAIFSSVNVALDDLDIGGDDDEPVQPTQNKAVKTHTIMRFKVPIEDQPMIEGLLKRIMKQQGFKDSDSLTNAGDALVWLCKQHEDQ